MQCPRCNTVLPANTLYCYSCGAKQDTQNQDDATQVIPPVAANEITVFPTPLTQPAEANGTFTMPALPASDAPSMEGGWAEFGGTQAPVGNTYPPVVPMPNGYESYGSTSHAPYAPNTFPPLPSTPTPKRQGGSLIARVLLSVLVLLLVLGGVLVGIRIGQAHNSTVSTQATAVVNATPTAQQLYQQITSQPPTFTDPLQDPTLSQWSTFTNATNSCEIQADGLHVKIQDAHRIIYCTSGQGQFSDFALQVKMQILSGEGGGMALRSNNQGNLYFFQVLPDGVYDIFIEQNHQAAKRLARGTISAFEISTSQKHTLTTIAKGNLMYFYVDQKFLTMVQDSTYTSGFIGVMSAATDVPGEVIYTNVQIWQL